MSIMIDNPLYEGSGDLPTDGAGEGAGVSADQGACGYSPGAGKREPTCRAPLEGDQCTTPTPTPTPSATVKATATKQRHKRRQHSSVPFSSICCCCCCYFCSGDIDCGGDSSCCCCCGLCGYGDGGDGGCCSCYYRHCSIHLFLDPGSQS